MDLAKGIIDDTHILRSLCIFRWGIGTARTHGGFYSGPDRFNPGTLQDHKWENAMTVDKQSWGIRRNINLEDVYTPPELIEIIAQTISCGGNILINVGPTKGTQFNFIK